MEETEEINEPMGESSNNPAIDPSDYVYKLLDCASKGDIVGLNQVLKEGALPDAADYDKRTALHLAASEGRTRIVELLLQYNASINPLDRWGRTPLSDARQYGHSEICRILEANGGIEETSKSLEFELDPSEISLSEGTVIGRGSYGEIRLVTWRGTKVAVKTIQGSLVSDPQIIKDFHKELKISKHLRHPNIVQFLGAITKGDQLAIVTEYLPKGNLYDILRKNGRLDASNAVGFALDIARGMNYLHEHKPEPLIHRDLTPKNLLLDEAGHLKVADFGLSRLVESTSKNILETYKMTGLTGSYRYMAPEVFKEDPYDKSVDVFSFAIIVAEMFEGGPSWSSEQPMWVASKRAKENVRPALTAHTYPSGLKELLRQCWDEDPSNRPTFAEIIKQLENIQRNSYKYKFCFCSCSIC